MIVQNHNPGAGLTLVQLGQLVMVVKLWFNMKNDGISSEYQRDQDIYVENTCCIYIPCRNFCAIWTKSTVIFSLSFGLSMIYVYYFFHFPDSKWIRVGVNIHMPVYQKNRDGFFW